jgi:predicted phosphate transport protein (TIGR00153 family)
MTERIRRWFGDYRNKIVLDMVKDHLGLTKNAVQALYGMINSASVDPEDKQRLYEELSAFEMKADDLRRGMIVTLTEREIFPSEREDLMELVRAVDWVADWSREAGRLLVIIPFHQSPEELKQKALEMSRAIIRSVDILAESINVLTEDGRKSLSLADQVELLEEDIDELYSQARFLIATQEFPEFSRGALILLNEFFDSLETVADWCENTVDVVRAVAVRTT